MTLQEAKIEYRRLEMEAQNIDDRLRAKMIEVEKLEARADTINWAQMDLLEEFGWKL